MGYKGKRSLVGSEPDNKKKIKTMIMKYMTGNDPIRGRKLYQSEFEYQPQFKILLLCNDIPEMDSTDDGVWSRLRVLNFPVKFVDGEPQGEFEKKMDKNLSFRIKEWQSDFILLLLEYLRKYKVNGLTPTKSINKMNGKYRKNTDPYLSFLDEKTETNESIEGISTKELYEEFKNWYSMNYPRSKIPSRNMFLGELKRHYKVAKIRLKTGTLIYGIKNLGLMRECLVNEDT
jgi:putative DNA primase/helicase